MKEETKGDQEPWLSMSIDGEFYFAQNVQGSSIPQSKQKTKPTPQPVPIDTLPAPAAIAQSLEPEMVTIKGGCFLMGSPKKEKNRNHDERLHKVCVNDFAIGKYEITQAQWQAIMDNNPSNFKGDNLPVESVAWNDVQEFIQKLNAQTGKNYRLPTEAEWEYAARAGTATTFYTGKTITNNQANFDGRTGKTTFVGSYSGNPWGLYDMLGNVWEWTCSTYFANYENSETQCLNRSNTLYTVRGGSWNSKPQSLRSATREWYAPVTRTENIGFRPDSLTKVWKNRLYFN